MTFLELCQRMASECGVSLTGPVDTTTQTGRLGQIVKWVNTAWMDIQTRHNEWLFMVGSFTVNTTASDGVYTASDCSITNFREWRKDTFHIYLTSAGVAAQVPLYFMEYMNWYHRYNVGTQTDGYPFDFTIGNDKSIILGPKPDAIYTVTGEYQKSASELSGDSDEPELPDEYHMAIVYGAMMKYGRYAGAPEVYSDGKNQYDRIMSEMMRTQLPEFLMADCL